PVQEVCRERVPQRVRAQVTGQVGPLRGSLYDGPGALAGQSPTALVQEDRRGAPALIGEDRAAADQPGLDGIGRVPAEWHDALLVALAEQPHHSLVRGMRAGPLAATQVEVVHVDPDGLADTRAGAVEHLEQRAVPEGDGRVADAGGVQEPLDLHDADRLRKPPGGGRWCDDLRRVVDHVPLRLQEAVESADYHERPGRRRGGQRRTIALARPQLGQEVGHRALAHRPGTRDPPGAQEVEVSAQVPLVRLERVLGGAPFHAEVVQPAARGARQRVAGGGSGSGHTVIVMQWYAETPARRTRQLIGDLCVLAWVILWILIGRWTFSLVRGLA